MASCERCGADGVMIDLHRVWVDGPDQPYSYHCICKVCDQEWVE